MKNKSSDRKLPFKVHLCIRTSMTLHIMIWLAHEWLIKIWPINEEFMIQFSRDTVFCILDFLFFKNFILQD